jgi:hypothetical protein
VRVKAIRAEQLALRLKLHAKKRELGLTYDDVDRAKAELNRLRRRYRTNMRSL